MFLWLYNVIPLSKNGQIVRPQWKNGYMYVVKFPQKISNVICFMYGKLAGFSPYVEKLNLSKLKYNDSKAEDFFNTLERVILCLEDLFICNLESYKSFCG